MFKTKVCPKREKPCCVVVVVGRAGQMLSASARPATALLSGDTSHISNKNGKPYICQLNQLYIVWSAIISKDKWHLALAGVTLAPPHISRKIISSWQSKETKTNQNVALSSGEVWISLARNWGVSIWFVRPLGGTKTWSISSIIGTISHPHYYYYY